MFLEHELPLTTHVAVRAVGPGAAGSVTAAAGSVTVAGAVGQVAAGSATVAGAAGSVTVAVGPGAVGSVTAAGAVAGGVGGQTPLSLLVLLGLVGEVLGWNVDLLDFAFWEPLHRVVASGTQHK